MLNFEIKEPGRLLYIYSETFFYIVNFQPVYQFEQSTAFENQKQIGLFTALITHFIYKCNNLFFHHFQHSLMLLTTYINIAKQFYALRLETA